MKNSRTLFFTLLVALTLCLVMLPGVKASTVTVKVTVKDSNEAGIGGVPVEYYTGSWQSFGTTDSSGLASKDLAGGTYYFRVTYAHNTQQINQDINSNNNVVFQTTHVTLYLKNHLGSTDLPGSGAEYYVDTWYTLGTGNTPAEMELLPGSYPFHVSYEHATQQQTVAVSGKSTDFVFQTALVTIELNDHNGNALSGSTKVQYYSGAWYDFASSATPSSKELLPGSYSFSVNYAGARNERWQTVSGSTTTVAFKTTLVTIVLNDHNDVALVPGGTNTQYYPGTWTNFGGGTTPSSMEILPGYYAFHLTYKTSTQQQWVTISVGTQDVTFKTTLVTMKVLASDHTTELSGTSPQYYTGNWYDFGTNGHTTDSMELLPANYAFHVTYNGLTQQQWQDVSVNPSVVFYTTKVTLQYSGTVRYWTGVWNTFTKPSMDLFPYTYPFQFDGYQTNIVVGSSDIVQSMVVVKFQKSNGAGIAGGTTQYYDGSWHAMGTTDSIGILIYGIPGLKGNLAFSMTYGGATTQKWQNIHDYSMVIFKTALVTMKLFAHDGTTVLTGTGAQYYTGTWNDFGSKSTTTSMELLPGNYCFKVNWAGASQQKWQTVTLDPATVVFQTTQVSMKLNDHDDNKLTLGGTNTQYYTGTWNGFGTGITETQMELLPGNYAFRLSYNGATQQKWQVIGSGPLEDVVFKTTKVVMRVEKADNTELSGTGAKYYTGSWNMFGTGNTIGSTMELLPGNYAFVVSYLGTTNQKWQVIGVGPSETVTFTTQLVTMTLIAHDGKTALTGTGAQYYTGSWNDFGSKSTPTSMELLPGNYAFRLTYSGATQQKWQDVGVNSDVVFTTTLVTMKLKNHLGESLTGSNPKYYTGTWNVFGTSDTPTSMELLPGNYAFVVSYLGTTNQKWQVIGTGPQVDVIFQTTLVTMKVLASGGGELIGTTARYYTGAWNTFDSGTTTSTMELLPGNYAFSVSYNGATQQKWQDVGSNPVVIFQTAKVTLQFSGTIKYYTGSWNAYTKPSMDLLPGNYAFSFDGYQMWLVVSSDLTDSIVVVKFLNHNNAGLADGTAQYYDGGWQNIGTTTSSGVLLYAIPGLKSSVSFSMNYIGARQEMTQDISGNSYVIFQTKLVTLSLKDSTGAALTSTKVEYYAGGWKTFGTSQTPASMELLPVTTYSFAVEYASARQEKPQNIVTDPNVIFQTGRVHSDSATCTQYYAGGWKAFTQDMELLPGSYDFLFNDGNPQTKYTIMAAVTNYIH